MTIIVHKKNEMCSSQTGADAQYKESKAMCKLITRVRLGEEGAGLIQGYTLVIPALRR